MGVVIIISNMKEIILIFYGPERPVEPSAFHGVESVLYGGREGHSGAGSETRSGPVPSRTRTRSGYLKIVLWAWLGYKRKRKVLM